MKVNSYKPKGQRMFKSIYFIDKRSGKKYKRPFWIEPIGKNWWFDLVIGEWVTTENRGTHRCTTSYYAMHHDGFNNVYSLKSAKRLIAKWDIPKGTWFRVTLPYIGYSFKVRK